MGKKNSVVSLGIEVAENGLRVAAVDHGAGKLLHISSVVLNANPLLEPGLIETTLGAWTQKINLHPTTITLTLPSSSSVVRSMRVPNEASVLREHVEWDLGSSLHSPLSDYHYDYHIAPGRNKYERTITVAAIRKPIVESLRAGLRRKDLSPNIVEVDVLSLLNLAEKADPAMAATSSCILKLDRTGLSAVWAGPQGLARHYLLPVKEFWALPNAESRTGAMQWAGQELAKAVADGFSCLGRPEGGRVLYLCGDLATDGALGDSLRALPGTEVRLLDTLRSMLVDTANCPAEEMVKGAAAIGAALRTLGDRK